VRVVLIAEETAGIQALRLLAGLEGVELVAALTSAPSSTKRGVVVADVAAKLDCAVMSAERVRDPAFADWLRDERVDMLINVHALYIIHGDVVAAPAIGSFNLHPGPLPRYAGLNAPSWAIVNGESRHAVTLHWMAAGVDTGAIAYESWFDLAPDATGLSCSMQCTRLGVPLVEKLVTTALDDPAAIPARSQDSGERVLYRKNDVPFDGKIDWGRTAAVLDAFIRAADYHPMPSPWGHPTTGLGDASLEVIKVARSGRTCEVPPGTLGAVEDGAVGVATGDEWLLLKRVQQQGRVLPPAALLEAVTKLGT